MSYIHVYNGTPTSGGTDGTVVSEVLPFTGSIASGSPTVSTTSVNTSTLTIGQAITGAGIPAGTTISAKPTSSSLTLSANATLTLTQSLMVQGNLITTNTINATTNEVSSSIKLALRCDTGYATLNNTTVTPVAAFSFTGDTQSGNASIINISIDTKNLGIGQRVLGTNIPAGATIATIVSSSSITISVNCTGTATGVNITQGDPAKWALAPDNAGSPGTYGAYGAALTIASSIDGTNYIFWTKAKSTSDESPINDITISLQTSAQIQAI
jgi:hypothetical protein